MTGPNSPHYFSPLKNAKNAQKILPKISKISKMRIFAVPPNNPIIRVIIRLLLEFEFY